MHIVEIGTGDSSSDGDAQRCVAGQRRMDAGRIVIGLEVGELSFEVSAPIKMGLFTRRSVRRAYFPRSEAVPWGRMRQTPPVNSLPRRIS